MTPNPYTLFVCFFAYAPLSLHAQSPGGVSVHLTLWVKADSAYPTAGGTLTKWADTKGMSPNTFSKVGTAPAPTVITNMMNFHPIVRWAGGAILKGNSAITWSECSAVACWRTGSNGAERGTIVSPTTNGTGLGDLSRYYYRSGVEGATPYLYSGMGSDSTGFEYVNAPADEEVNLYTTSGLGDVLNKNGLDARVGSLYGGFTKRGTSMTGIPQLGDRSTLDSRMNGDIAEVIVYSVSNAGINRNKVESYLALKYGITLGTPASPLSYISSAGTTFWTANATYQRNVFGIGADNASGLVQSTSNSINSGSGNGTGKNGLGNLVLTANSTLTNQQFLMIGADAGSLSEETINSTIGPSSAIGSVRVFRNWKVQNTGAIGPVKLTFDKTGLSLTGGNTASKYWLVIDNDGDGDYNTGTQGYIQASSITSNIITFNSPTLSNNVVFTLVTKVNTIIPLPLNWGHFTASAQQHTVTLQWTTGNEVDVDHFEIERSANAIDFTRAGSMEAKNGSGEQTYTFRLEEPAGGDFAYRIRAIDRDGAARLSEIRTVHMAGSFVLQIRSNPVRDNQLQLEIGLPQKSQVMIQLADRQGNPVLKAEKPLEQGSNHLTIDLSSLAAGLYFVQVRAGKLISTQGFLKY